MRKLFVLDEKNYTDDMPVVERYGVRGIICKNGKYAMQRGSSGKYKIPGGGMEKGETFMETLMREVREEVGLLVIPASVKEIGEITEIREDSHVSGQKYIAHSLYYSCEVEDEVQETKMTESELREGYHLEWATLEEIIETNNRLQVGKPIMRDTRFLEWLKQQEIIAAK